MLFYIILFIFTGLFIARPKLTGNEDKHFSVFLCWSNLFTFFGMLFFPAYIRQIFTLILHQSMGWEPYSIAISPLEINISNITTDWSRYIETSEFILEYPEITESILSNISVRTHYINNNLIYGTELLSALSMQNRILICIGLLLYTELSRLENSVIVPIFKRAVAFKGSYSTKTDFMSAFTKNYDAPDKYMKVHIILHSLMFLSHFAYCFTYTIIKKNTLFQTDFLSVSDSCGYIIINLLYHIAAYLIIRHIFYDTLYKLRGSEPQPSVD